MPILRIKDSNDQWVEIPAIIGPKGENTSNLIINGGFDVWQRGTSQTSSGYGSDDRWKNTVVSSTATYSRQSFNTGQTDVPNNPVYFSRTVVTTVGTSGSRSSKAQNIEDVTLLSGKTVTLSFWAKADTNRTIAVEFGQNFGSNGDIVVVGFDVEKFSVTSSWQRFTKTVTLPSVSGKTIGTNHYTQVSFWFDAGSDFNSRTSSLGNQSGTFDIAQVQLTLGGATTSFEHRSFGEELALCQRYYQRISASSVWSRLGSGQCLSSTQADMQFMLPIEMRIPPTLVTGGSLAALTSAAGYQPVTSIVGYSSTKSRLVFTVSVASGLVAGDATQIATNNDINAYIGFDAEF